MGIRRRRQLQRRQHRPSHLHHPPHFQPHCRRGDAETWGGRRAAAAAAAAVVAAAAGPASAAVVAAAAAVGREAASVCPVSIGACGGCRGRRCARPALGGRSGGPARLRPPRCSAIRGPRAPRLTDGARRHKPVRPCLAATPASSSATRRHHPPSQGPPLLPVTGPRGGAGETPLYLQTAATVPAGVVGLPPAFRRRGGERHVMIIMSAAPSSSFTHFDDTSSVLRVVAGHKEVWLRAPFGRGAPDPSGPGSLWSVVVRVRPLRRRQRPGTAGLGSRGRLSPGSALFILRRWWHSASSSAGTVATSTCAIPASPMASAAHGGESHVRRRRRISPAEAGATDTARHVADAHLFAARRLTSEWLATEGRRNAPGGKEARYPADLCGAKRCHLRAAFAACGDSCVGDVRALEQALWQGEGALRFVGHWCYA